MTDDPRQPSENEPRNPWARPDEWGAPTSASSQWGASAQPGDPHPAPPATPYAAQPSDPYAARPTDPYAARPADPYATQSSDSCATQSSDSYAARPSDPYAAQGGYTYGPTGTPYANPQAQQNPYWGPAPGQFPAPQPHPSQGQQVPPGMGGWAPPAQHTAARYQQPVQTARPRPVVRASAPVVTWTVVALCVLVWLGELFVPGVYESVVLTPYLGQSQPWRIITSAFAHSPTAITHIMFNMWALWAVGQAIEGALGRWRYLALYLLSAVGGGLAYILLATPGDDSWFTQVVGASGAVFGLFGALLVLQRLVGQSTQQLWVVLAINAAIPLFIPGIAWQAHAGGFVVGMLVAWLDARAIRQANAGRPDRTWLWNGLVAAGLVALLVAKYALAG